MSDDLDGTMIFHVALSIYSPALSAVRLMSFSKSLNV